LSKKIVELFIYEDLHQLLSLYLRTYGGRLADQDGYRAAYKRAIEEAGGRVTGTHGLRRLSVQEFYRQRYRAAVGDGLSPQAAAERAAGDAIERLGHSRDRRDHRRTYLGR
jgi:ribosomal protein S12 methylthiotransferase accessory factor YcaO